MRAGDNSIPGNLDPEKLPENPMIHLAEKAEM